MPNPIVHLKAAEKKRIGHGVPHNSSHLNSRYQYYYYCIRPLDTVIMARGAFIVIEGLDRSGKTTQTELLTKHLTTRGISIERRKFPGE